MISWHAATIIQSKFSSLVAMMALFMDGISKLAQSGTVSTSGIKIASAFLEPTLSKLRSQSIV
jgi:hypothetical protein